MAQTHYQPTQDDMEGLFVNNEKLDQLSLHLNKFNPIRTMRMEGMEIRHSAILSWLLNPRETHGFGDQFLRSFLAEAIRGQGDQSTPTALEIYQSELGDAEIRREKDNIDILVVSKAHGWAFIIENKFRSRLHSRQLENYLNRVIESQKRIGQKFNTRGIFLSLMDEEPKNSSYVPIRYSDVCRLLGQLMNLRQKSLSQDVLFFLNHYLEVIKDATGMNEERNQMESLARELYRDHKRVLDFVFEHGANTDFIFAANRVFDPDDNGLNSGDVVNFQKKEYVINGQNSSQFSFLPKTWVDSLGGEQEKECWEGCEKWWAGFPVICWLQIFKSDDSTQGSIRLYAEVGPIKNHENRLDLINLIGKLDVDTKNLIGFQNGAVEDGKRYSKFLKNNKVKVNDIHDSEQIEKTIKSLMEKFNPVFEAVAEILPEYFSKVKSENR